MKEQIEVTVNGTAYTVEVSGPNGSPVEVRVNGCPYIVEWEQPEAPIRIQRPAPAAGTAPGARPGNRPPASSSQSSGGGSSQRVMAPMPGKILSVAAQVGCQVQAKAPLCTLEAMKMEMTVSAPVAGTLREVHVQVGQSVTYGDLLFVIE